MKVVVRIPRNVYSPGMEGQIANIIKQVTNQNPDIRVVKN